MKGAATRAIICFHLDPKFWGGNAVENVDCDTCFSICFKITGFNFFYYFKRPKCINHRFETTQKYGPFALCEILALNEWISLPNSQRLSKNITLPENAISRQLSTMHSFYTKIREENHFSAILQGYSYEPKHCWFMLRYTIRG